MMPDMSRCFGQRYFLPDQRATTYLKAPYLFLAGSFARQGMSQCVQLHCLCAQI